MRTHARADHSGTIDRDEFGRGVVAILRGGEHGEVSAADLDALFISLDQDGNGTISYGELYNMLKAKRGYLKDLLQISHPPPPVPKLPRELHHRKAEVTAELRAPLTSSSTSCIDAQMRLPISRCDCPCLVLMLTWCEGAARE